MAQRPYSGGIWFEGIEFFFKCHNLEECKFSLQPGHVAGSLHPPQAICTFGVNQCGTMQILTADDF